MSRIPDARELPLQPCRILIADDSKLVRSIVGKLMQSELGLDICGEAVDGPDAIAKIKSLQPDIVLLDLSLPSITGLGVVDLLKDEASCSWVLMSEQDSGVLETLTVRAGLRYCIPKLDLATLLIPLLRQIAQERPCSIA